MKQCNTYVRNVLNLGSGFFKSPLVMFKDAKQCDKAVSCIFNENNVIGADLSSLYILLLSLHSQLKQRRNSMKSRTNWLIVECLHYDINIYINQKRNTGNVCLEMISKVMTILNKNLNLMQSSLVHVIIAMNYDILIHRYCT